MGPVNFDSIKSLEIFGKTSTRLTDIFNKFCGVYEPINDFGLYLFFRQWDRRSKTGATTRRFQLNIRCRKWVWINCYRSLSATLKSKLAYRNTILT